MAWLICSSLSSSSSSSLWLNAIDRGEMIGVVSVDFKKVFDLVEYDILLTKLKSYGINNETLHWFKSYLSHRQQQV